MFGDPIIKDINLLDTIMKVIGPKWRVKVNGVDHTPENTSFHVTLRVFICLPQRKTKVVLN